MAAAVALALVALPGCGGVRPEQWARCAAACGPHGGIALCDPPEATCKDGGWFRRMPDGGAK